MNGEDTIAAIATAPGRGGIGIVRVSGPLAPTVATELLGDVPPARSAALRIFRDHAGEMLDGGIAIFYPAPASFTGEDVLELQGHGGPVVLDLLLARILTMGVRHAHPGEFSRRAFLNEKLDLAQAESIADLIDSGSAEAARAALRSLQGQFSAEVNSLVEALIAARMHVEAAIDFPDDEVDFLDDADLHARLASLAAMTAHLKTIAREGAALREGLTIVIAGRPNAGKSSLLNRLAGYDAAIVTEIPGTTRDVLRERISLDGLPLHVIDTAGLRADADVVEAEGIRRAHDEMRRADRILYLIDATRGSPEEDWRTELAALPDDVAVTVLLNKIDLSGDAAGVSGATPPVIRLSLATGAGFEHLRDHLKQCAGYHGPDAGLVSARRRHVDAIDRAARHVAEASGHLDERRAGELVAEELRQAQIALDEITGEFTTEDLLGRIFASFCLGK
jgi:tRNA modification GTPase